MGFLVTWNRVRPALTAADVSGWLHVASDLVHLCITFLIIIFQQIGECIISPKCTR